MDCSQKDICIALATTADKRRFWSKVSKQDSCWVWQGSAGKGYGYFWVQGATVRAHRAAKLWSEGKKRAGAFLCCHRCNNPSCVRPSHIYWGSNADNSKDTVAAGVHKKRIWRGSACWSATIDEQQAQAIVDRYYLGGISSYQLAKQFRIGRGAVDSLLRGKTWAHCVKIPKIPLLRSQMGYRRGAAVAHAKLNERQVREIRRLRNNGMYCKEIAKKFGVAQTNVSAICNGQTWRHVK